MVVWFPSASIMANSPCSPIGFDFEIWKSVCWFELIPKKKNNGFCNEININYRK